MIPVILFILLDTTVSFHFCSMSDTSYALHLFFSFAFCSSHYLLSLYYIFEQFHGNSCFHTNVTYLESEMFPWKWISIIQYSSYESLLYQFVYVIVRGRTWTIEMEYDADFYMDGSGLELVHVSDVLDYLGKHWLLFK